MDADGFLTPEELTAESEFTFTRQNGSKIHCRRISSREYNALLAEPPQEAESWPQIAGEGEALTASIAAREKAEQAWLRTLPLEKQIQYRQPLVDVRFRALALVALRPKLTFELARRLGDEAEHLFVELLKQSFAAAQKPADGAAVAAGEEGPGAP